MADYLDSAMKRVDEGAAKKREAEQNWLKYAARPHARDGQLDELCLHFAERMPHASGKPFTSYRLTMGHREERGKRGRRVLIPTSHEEYVATTHGWIIPKLGRWNAFFYQTTSATYWHGLGVTIAGEPVFVLTDPLNIRIDDGPIRAGSALLSQQEIHRQSSTHPLINPGLGSISVGNKCECILSTLSLQYRDKSKPTYREIPFTGVMKTEYPMFPDQAKQLLEAIAESMASLLTR